MRRAVRILLQFVVGLAAVVALIVAVRGCARTRQEQRVPPGWTIIRPPGEVACLLPEEGWIWAGGRDGLFRVAREEGKILPATAGEPEFGYVHALLRDASGAVWFAHDGGVAVWREGAWQRHGRESGAPFRRAYSLAEEEPGIVMVGADTGLVRWRAGGWEVEWAAEEAGLGEIDVLYRDRDGRLWAGSSSPARGGLRVREAGRWRAIDAGRLPHPSVNAVMQARDGSIWVGTGFAGHGGAAVLGPGSSDFVAVGLAAPWDAVKARSLFQDRVGRIWLGLEYDGVLVWNGARWSRIGPDEGLAGQEVKVVREDGDGTFWLGTNGGLSRLDASAPVFESLGSAPP